MSSPGPGPHETHERQPGRGRWAALLVVALVLGLIGVGLVPRLARQRALDARAASLSGPPRVAVAFAKKGATRAELVLSGTALPAAQTVIHARLDGFVGELRVDLGDRVKEGQLLAVLQAPELEAELARARARLGEVERNLELSRASAERHARLSGIGISSQEAADEARARANSAEAGLEVGRAEVTRLQALFAYRRVLAPFDGVITQRHVDRGALVKSAATALFDIAQLKTLKVFVDVPQTLAADVRAGGRAEVFAPEAPTRLVAAKVVRTAGALDPGTRTLRTELHLANDGSLLAGAFVRVRLAIDRDVRPVIIPASALSLRKEGPRVLVVGEGGRVRQLAVAPGRDLGTEIEVLGGLDGGERVVLSPPDDLADGAPVLLAEDRRAP